MSLFSRRPRRQIGVDIGTSSIKVVELSREGSHPALQNYGLIEGLDFFGEVFAEEEIIAALKELLKTTRIQTREAVFSIPIFSSFLTVMELPQMNLKDLERAVPFSARSYIPVPISEVVLDWLAIPPRSSSSSPAQAISVLLVAVSKEVVSKYRRVVEGAGLVLQGLEPESFSLVRSLVGTDPEPVMLADLGARSTTLTIVEQGFVKLSHTVQFSGIELTKTIARGLSVSLERAEELKRTTGLAPTSRGEERGIAGLVRPALDRLADEYEKMASSYFRKEGVKLGKIILAGGMANLPGFRQYLQGRLNIETIVGDPFGRVSYAKEVKPLLKPELATPLAVTVGLALRDF